MVLTLGVFSAWSEERREADHGLEVTLLQLLHECGIAKVPGLSKVCVG